MATGEGISDLSPVSLFHRNERMGLGARNRERVRFSRRGLAYSGWRLLENLLQKKFLQFFTPWTGASLSNLQGFGKFIMPLPMASSMPAPHLGLRAAIIFTAATGEIVGAVNRNIWRKNHVAYGNTGVTAHIATRCPAIRIGLAQALKKPIGEPESARTSTCRWKRMRDRAAKSRCQFPTIGAMVWVSIPL